jgi:type II secretion system protein N
VKNTVNTPRAIEESDYPSIPLARKKIIAVFIGLSLLSFIYAFPFNQKLENIIRNSVRIAAGCNLNFKELKFEFLLPKIVINDLNLPSSCIGGDSSSLNFKQLRLYFRGPSFSPLGIALKLETQFLKTDVNVYLALGLNSQTIKLEQQFINFAQLSEFIPEVKINGQLELNGVVKLHKNNLEQISGYIRSQDVIFPPQNIQGFNTPELSPRNFIVKLETDVNNSEHVNIQEFIIGDQSANIRAKFNGKIFLNNRSLAYSRLDLKGEFALSPDIIKEFAIIESLLSSYNKTDEFYQVQIIGTLNSPSIRSN